MIHLLIVKRLFPLAIMHAPTAAGWSRSGSRPMPAAARSSLSRSVPRHRRRPPAPSSRPAHPEPRRAFPTPDRPEGDERRHRHLRLRPARTRHRSAAPEGGEGRSWRRLDRRIDAERDQAIMGSPAPLLAEDDLAVEFEAAALVDHRPVDHGFGAVGSLQPRVAAGAAAWIGSGAVSLMPSIDCIAPCKPDSLVHRPAVYEVASLRSRAHPIL